MNNQDTLSNRNKLPPRDAADVQRFTDSRGMQKQLHGYDDAGSVQIVQLETPKESQRSKNKQTIVVETSRTSQMAMTDRHTEVVMTMQPRKGKVARAIRNSILRSQIQSPSNLPKNALAKSIMVKRHLNKFNISTQQVIEASKLSKNKSPLGADKQNFKLWMRR